MHLCHGLFAPRQRCPLREVLKLWELVTKEGRKDIIWQMTRVRNSVLHRVATTSPRLRSDVQLMLVITAMEGGAQITITPRDLEG